jgi:hypothetical protein
MPSSPGTVSKILWHFTGGPKWNEAEDCQEKQKKPICDAYAALIEILMSKNLRIGQYKEVLRAIFPRVPHLDPTGQHVIESTNLTFTAKSSPVCCLADIPIMHLDYHAERYGKIAIGFHRESAIRHDFNPVHYLLNSSAILHSLCNALAEIGATDDRRLNEYKDGILTTDLAACDPIPPNVTPEFLAGKMIDIATFAMNRLNNGALFMRHVLAFIKSFNSAEFGTIYCEREWRSIDPFNFEYSDVSMIVLPRRGDDALDYYERFVKQAETLGVPKTVSIVAWEDLVEH